MVQLRSLANADTVAQAVAFSLVQKIVDRTGRSPIFLFDEAHRWLDAGYGRFEDSRGVQVSFVNGRPWLPCGINHVRNALVCPSVWAGTALSLGDLRKLQSAAGLVLQVATDIMFMEKVLMLDFKPLQPSDVEHYLRHFLPEDLVADGPMLDCIAHGLQGRARLAASFVASVIVSQCGTVDGVASVFRKLRGQSLAPQITGDASRLLVGFNTDFLSMWRNLLRKLRRSSDMSLFEKLLRAFASRNSYETGVTVGVLTDTIRWADGVDLVHLGFAMYAGPPEVIDGGLLLKVVVNEPLVWRAALMAAPEFGIHCEEHILSHLGDDFVDPDAVGNDIELLTVHCLRAQTSPMRQIYNWS